MCHLTSAAKSIVLNFRSWHASRLCGEVSKFLQTESSCEKHHLCSIFVVTFSLILVKKSFSKYEEIISNYSNFNILYKPFPISNFPEIISKRATKMISYVLEMIISCAKKNDFHLEMIFLKWFTATKNDFWLFFAEKKWFTAVKNHLLPVQKWLIAQENDFEGVQKWFPWKWFM